MMIKELYEAIDNLWANLAYTEYTENDSIRDRNLLIEAVKRLEAIDNSNPSEALECFEWIIKNYIGNDYYVYEEELDTIKQSLLKSQEQEKVLDIIKKKCLYTDNLNEVATCLNYNYYKERMSKKYDTKVVKTDWNDKVLLDYLKLLTQEEFDLLKRYCK